MPYYAVCVGKVPGIYENWKDASAQVSKFPSAIYKKFPTYDDAKRFLDERSPCQIRKEEPHSSDVMQIYTDGSMKDGKCGYGIVLVKNGQRYKVAGPVPQHMKQTSSVAEFYAIKRALEMVLPSEKIVVHSDSHYAVSSINDYIRSWRESDQGERRANYNLIDEIEKTLRSRNAQLFWIRSHANNQFNEMADRLANHGREINEETTSLE